MPQPLDDAQIYNENLIAYIYIYIHIYIYVYIYCEAYCRAAEPCGMGGEMFGRGERGKEGVGWVSEFASCGASVFLWDSLDVCVHMRVRVSAWVRGYGPGV